MAKVSPIKIKKPPAKAPVFVDERPHYCSCCGKDYPVQQKNFSKSRSPLYVANGGYVTVCNTCRDGWFDMLGKTFGADKLAIERVCQVFDIPYDENVVTYMRDEGKGRNALTAYLASIFLNQRKQKTYSDTVKARQGKMVEPDAPAEAASLFGTSYKPKELEELMNLYGKYVSDYGDASDRQVSDAYVNLALLDFRIRKEHQTGGKDVVSLMRYKTAIIKDMGFKSRSVLAQQATLGVTIADIEKWSPADYYADKKRYRDFFGIEEYINRFIIRPMKNLLFGSSDEDPEHFVGEDAK